MNPINNSPYPDVTWEERRLSQSLLANGPLSDATAVLEKLLIDVPDDADLLLDLGYTYMKNKDWLRASATLERAASLRPEDATIQYAQVQLSEAQGDFLSASELLGALVLRSPDLHLVNTLSLLLMLAGRWDEAKKIFAQLRRLDPDHELTILYGYIWCQIKTRDWRQAFDLVLETTRLDRYGLTTALLSYVKKQLFEHVPGHTPYEDELSERIMAELRNHSEFHISEEFFGSIESEKERENG